MSLARPTPNTLKVLVSAFACSPYQGSEEGVGWRWALETAQLGHDVTVLTRTRFKTEIERYIAENPKLPEITFVYKDIWRAVKYEGLMKLVGYAYIYIWQIYIIDTAKNLHNAHKFDLIHHITFGTIRFPSFLGGIGVPLVYGPAGGGETAPKHLRRSYPLRGKFIDGLRELSCHIVRYDPMANYTFATAGLIVLRTAENARFLPAKAMDKVIYEHEVGIDLPTTTERADNAERPLRLLYVGRFLYWKGMHLGLPAFDILLKSVPNATLTMVGKGPEQNLWKSISKRLGVDKQVRWVEWVDKSDMAQLYAEHDALLFPSLHDAGANVVYEAAAFGLPIICLKLGAPGEVVTSDFGFPIEAIDREEQAVVQDLAKAMQKLADDRGLLRRLSHAAQNWAATQTWQSRVAFVYQEARKLVEPR